MVSSVIGGNPSPVLSWLRKSSLRLALLGCVMGTLLGFSLIFLVEYLDHSLTTVEEVEQYLGLPVLGTIPRMILRTSKRGRKVRIAVFLVLGMLVVVLIVIFIKQRMVGA